ncbi:MAG: S8 family serine peptidase [Cyclobacteriaceae bacterium]
MMKNLFALLMLSCAFNVFGQKGSVSTSLEEGAHMPHVVVVKFHSGSETLPLNYTNARVDHPVKRTGIEIVSAKNPFRNLSNARSQSRSGIDFSSFQILRLGADEDVIAAVSKLQLLESVEYAEPLYLHESTLVPNDPRVSEQSEYLEPIRAYEAWDITTGSSDIVIAIIDDGLDYNHDDLDDKIELNEDEIPDNGIDDDDDGYIDNYLGWDFIGADIENPIEDNDPIGNGNLGHGTWVAGFAVAETNNSIGIAGVGYDTKYMALKCGVDGGERILGNTQLAVIYAADQGADIINMSYGSSFFSQFGQDVMTYAAVEKGSVLIAAAGNEASNQISYPAGYEHVLSVAATDNNDIKAGFSNFGSWVDLSAPGVGILTTGQNNIYQRQSGTSFSAPIVSGAAALILAKYPDFSPFQIHQLLIQSTDFIDSVNLESLAGDLGSGRLNIERALTATVPAFELLETTILNSAGTIPGRGETGQLDIRLRNALFNSSSEAQLQLFVLDSSDIQIENTTVALGVVEAGQTIILSDLGEITVSSEETFNKTIPFSVVFSDAGFDYKDSVNFTIQINPLVTQSATVPYLLSDGGDFESSPGDFASAPLVGQYSIWELGVPGNVLNEANSDSTVWKTLLNEDLPKDSYANVLQSPVFNFSDISKDYRLSYYKSMEAEFCNAPAAVQMQYSLDGETWEVLGSKFDPLGFNWYNKAPGDACAVDPSIIADQNGWLGNFVNEYTEFNVSEFAGETQVTFRFVLYVSGSFNGNPDDGFMIDDFQIETRDPSAHFTSNRTVIYTGDSISFTYLSGGASSFNWNFGDGGTASTASPSHVYSSPGVYDVSLSIGSNAGDRDTTIANLITVLPNLSTALTLADGGDFESNFGYFGVENVSGSGFTLGKDSIPGKDGTASGDHAWVVAFGQPVYEDLSEAYLYSPNFNFQFIGNYSLGFKAKYVFEDTWDGFIIEYSLDKGASWTKLNESLADGWYNTISHPNAIFGANVPMFSGSTAGEFEEYETSVSFLSGESSVAFRVVFLTDPATVDVGMALDDFFVSFPQTGAITANFEVDGYEGCQGQELEFTSTSIGSITSMEWDFGQNASISSASGPGPHFVSYDSLGSSVVTLTVGGQGTTQTETFEVLSGAKHIPTFTYSFNSSGNVDFIASEGDEYQWFMSNTPIDGANLQTYEATERGTYSVLVTIDGCPGSSVVSPFIVTDLEENMSFTVYPNPVKDGKLQIAGLEGERVSIEIHDIAGRMWFTDTVSRQNPKNLDISALSSGQYILSIQTEEKYYQAKLIIQ